MTIENPEPEQLATPSALAAGAGFGKSRRRTLIVITALVALAAAGSGIGYTLLHHPSRPVRSAQASPSATPSPSFGAYSNGNHFGSLSDLLLPMPAGYAPGADDGELGNNAVLSGKGLQQLYSDEFGSLPAASRQQMRRFLDSLDVHGIGLRTYRDTATGEQADEIVLTHLDRSPARALTAFDEALAQGINGSRNGPSVPGHPDAHCYLSPTTNGNDQLDSMMCFASVGDLMVDLEDNGPAPLDTQDAVHLLARQLDRLKPPTGAAV